MGELVHQVTIQISEDERRRALDGYLSADPGGVGLVARVRAAARLLPAQIRVGDMVDPVAPVHRVTGRYWPAEVVALRDGVAWLWFVDPDAVDGPRSGIWNLSDVEVV